MRNSRVGGWGLVWLVGRVLSSYSCPERVASLPASGLATLWYGVRVRASGPLRWCWRDSAFSTCYCTPCLHFLLRKGPLHLASLVEHTSGGKENSAQNLFLLFFLLGINLRLTFLNSKSFWFSFFTNLSDISRTTSMPNIDGGSSRN